MNLYIPQSSQSLIAQSPIAQNQTEQVTSVNQLQDVQSKDWAFQSLQQLVERYGCIAGYPNRSFLGSRAITRSEFAAGLNACLGKINDQITSSTRNLAKSEDLVTVQKLQADFEPELASLKQQTNQLETKTTLLQKQHFSTTTKLTGQLVFAVSGGGFGGDRIIAPRGTIVTQNQPNITNLYRMSVDLNTSFSGTDLFKLRLLSASPGTNDNTAGFLEPNLGSVLDYAVPGRSQLSIGRAYYTFTPTRDLNVTLGAQMVAPDFIDKNRYANASFRDFSTSALVNNFILLPRPGGTGAAIDWNPNKGNFSLRGVYVASSGSGALPENQQFFGGGQVNDIRLFPTAGGRSKGGLFGDPYMGIVELEYAPTKAIALRLQYSGGELLGSNFGVFGVNAELAITSKVGVFARYGSGHYPKTISGDLRPQYWSAGLAFQDLFLKSDLAGIGIVQPFILNTIGNATQTNFELFYNIPLSKNVRLTPIVQVITNAGNQRGNGTIVTGTLRTVFLF